VQATWVGPSRVTDRAAAQEGRSPVTKVSRLSPVVPQVEAQRRLWARLGKNRTTHRCRSRPIAQSGPGKTNRAFNLASIATARDVLTEAA
jgi:hypothetical protein